MLRMPLDLRSRLSRGRLALRRLIGVEPDRSDETAMGGARRQFHWWDANILAAKNPRQEICEPSIWRLVVLSALCLIPPNPETQ